MHRVILAALSDSKADQLLAGLPAICRARLPEQSVPSEKRSAKRAARTSLSSSHRTDLAHENLRAVRDAGRDGPNLNQALESKED
jgi:hypothetical protein